MVAGIDGEEKIGVALVGPHPVTIQSYLYSGLAYLVFGFLEDLYDIN
jgi:hypothetical protein